MTRTLRLITCLCLLAAAVPAAAATPELRLVPYASGFSTPVAFVQDPLDANVQYVVQQTGRVRTVVAGQVQPTDFINLTASISSGGERGLLGMAFDPSDPSRVFFNFTSANPLGATVVARFARSGRVANLASRFDLVWSNGLPYIPQPFENHNGGCLAFGPDGYLYIGMGDGGSGGDPNNLAQNPNELLGKILRIDVRGTPANGFTIPGDNPFRTYSRPEIWSIGLRNPWRFSFDDVTRGGTGAMLIGDVGQGAWEEVDYEPRGAGGRNYGWRILEGTHRFSGEPNPGTLVNPIYEYDHTVGASITGGYVYRGSTVALRGRYFFADFVRGRIWSLRLTINPSTHEATAADVIEHTAQMSFTGNVSSFGVDASGELYVVSYGGSISRIAAVPSPPGPIPPAADFNTDGRPDLVWSNPTTGQLAWWGMGGGPHGEAMMAASGLNAPALPAAWHVVGSGDADGDGDSDLFLQSDDGDLGIWFFNGSDFRFGLQLTPNQVTDTNWQVRAVGDVNHDGHPDLIWQYAPTGQLAFWLLDGTTVMNYVIPIAPSPGADWVIVGAGDANGDGELDLFWQQQSTGTLAVWRMQGTALTAGVLLSASPPATWRVVAVADLDGDGFADLIFQNSGTNQVAAWYFMDTMFRFGVLLSPSTAGTAGWRVVGPR
jgi:glucose/arabinose dehydrogenase